MLSVEQQIRPARIEFVNARTCSTCAWLWLRLPHSPGARRVSLRRLRTQSKGPHELVQARIIGGIQQQLVAPCGRYYARGTRAKARSASIWSGGRFGS